jgi:hypothetical protein
MSTNDGQCYGDRRDGEPIPPPRKWGGRVEAKSRQLGTEKQKGSTLKEVELPSLRQLARVRRASRNT